MKSIFRFFLFFGIFVYAVQAAAVQPACAAAGRNQVALALGATHLAQWLTVEAASCEELVLRPSGVEFRLGEKTLPVYGGNRSEVAVNFPFEEGDTVTYTWEMKLPESFAGDPLQRWWLLAQWHDQPDKRIAQTWAGFPSRSPPVALYIEERNSVLGMGVIFDGKDKRSWAPLPRNEWLKVSVTIRWSTQADGELGLIVENKPEFSIKATGRNMHNSFQHYLKFGQYRHKQVRLETSVYFRRLEISRTN